MYAPTSTNSPRSGPTSGDDDGLTDFDGAGEILRTWGSGLRPDPDLTVTEWADRHCMLSGRASAEPGRYRTVRTPYMREIMDQLSPGDPTQRIVFMKAAQVGATEAGNNWIGFAIHQAPGPMLTVQPTVELAKRNSRQRIDLLVDESPELRDRVKPARSRDAGNTMLSKEFAGGILIMTGANSAVGLRSTPARYIFLDEVDAYGRSPGAGSSTNAHRRSPPLASGRSAHRSTRRTAVQEASVTRSACGCASSSRLRRAARPSIAQRVGRERPDLDPTLAQRRLAIRPPPAQENRLTHDRGRSRRQCRPRWANDQIVQAFSLNGKVRRGAVPIKATRRDVGAPDDAMSDAGGPSPCLDAMHHRRRLRNETDSHVDGAAERVLRPFGGGQRAS
ncbi:Phage terminase large subunit (GpA) [Rubrimonas cliftonensis]|uniref:Phage terminase large subunit (GpA) n=1 Tax=Rubrimonas cliftonensis TaxID=89524 RepID=A0A1H4FKT7_9RHOB|nr:phage terminase large subunit family protein [Rubrimonas cliftonensis]SEA97771.1 Phage terminase large subunit (GpA) [Rubrimonas cliftonensis]